MRRVRTLCLTHTSGFAIGFQYNQQQPLHPLAWQTIMLKVGLRLGFVQTMGNA